MAIPRDAIPRDFLYQRYEEESRYTILASDLTLTDDLIDPTKDCVIYADALTLDGKEKLVFPGRNLTVCCRSLNPNGVMLSTQPPDQDKQAPPPKPRTSDDPAVNKGNPNGQNADPITEEDYGAAGGNITILADIIERPLALNSSGGKGRDGQNGGDAARGTQGERGKDDERKTKTIDHRIEPDGKYPGTPGHQGHVGGTGGNGGAPGFGGNAGAITVSTVTKPPAITSTAAGGSCGKPGSPGNGGRGGLGGHGGRIGEWKKVSHSHKVVLEFFLTNNRYADGPRGPAGQKGQVINGEDGAKGPVTTEIMNDIQATIKADAHLFAQLQMMMQVVKIHYLGGDFQRAGRVLTWIFNLTAKRDAAENATKWLGLHQQAATYLSRLSRGLDYFGNAANFVPTASFSLYCSTVTPMLELGGTVQAVFNTYTEYLQDQKSEYDDFSRAYSAGSKAIETYKDAITAEIKQRNTLWDECTALEAKIFLARSRMLSAEDSFKSKVIEKEKCKKYEVIVKLVGSLSGFPGDITDVWKDVKDKSGGLRFSNSGLKFAGNLPGNFLDLVKDIKVLASDWSDAAKQFDSIEHSLETDGADSVKLAADVAAVDKKLADYMDLYEAQAYREVIQNYVELCKARNMKVIQCSKLDEDVLQLYGKIDQTTAQMNELKGAESGKLDPTLAPYRNFLLGLYNNYKDSLIDKLFYETLAYRYRTLQDFSKILQGGNTIAELSVMQGQILQDVIDYENKVTRIEQPFENLITHPMKYASTDSIAAFRKDGALSFHIPLNEKAFRGLAQLQLTKFTVSIPGVRFQSDSKTVYVRLKCHGDCSVVDPKSPSTIFHFTHNPITESYEYEVIEHGNGSLEERWLVGGALVNTEDGSGQKSISLSPFCTWSISLPPEYNTGVDLSQVSDVILGFGGKGVPISPEYRAIWAAKWQS